MLEAEEQVQSLASELRAALERLGAVHARWQEGIPGLRNVLASRIGSIEETLGCVKDTARALMGVAGAYAQAERLGLGNAAAPNAPQTAQAPGSAAASAGALSSPLAGAPPSRVVFGGGETVMPDWLAAAVLKYEAYR